MGSNPRGESAPAGSHRWFVFRLKWGQQEEIVGSNLTGESAPAGRCRQCHIDFVTFFVRVKMGLI